MFILFNQRYIKNQETCFKSLHVYIDDQVKIFIDNTQMKLKQNTEQGRSYVHDKMIVCMSMNDQDEEQCYLSFKLFIFLDNGVKI